MKKTLLLSTLLIFSVLLVRAQDDNTQTKISAGFNVGVNTGPTSGDYPIAAGIAFRIEYPLEGIPVSLMFTAGYTAYVSGNGYSTGYYYGDGGSGSYSYGNIASFIPLEVGAKFYVAHRIFIEGDAGASFNIGSVNNNNIDGTTTTNPPSKVALLVSPSAGFTVPFGNSRFSLDLSLGYEDRIQSGGGFSQVAFRAQFNLGM